MDYQRIRLEFKDQIAVLTLNHPEALNAVSRRMISELLEVMDLIGDGAHGARCLLMTGAGRGFCAGANLADPDKALDQEPGESVKEALEEFYHPFLLKLRNLKMPFITAVNGPAAGVGMSFALSGDIILAARSAYFLQAFRRIGLIPDGGSTFLLPRLVGKARGMELSLLAERLPAEKALEWGLINRVYDDERLMPEAMSLAREMASGPTRAYHLIRKAFWKSWDNSYEDQLQVECECQKEASRTEDFVEGVSAFLEKRPAAFKGI